MAKNTGSYPGVEGIDDRATQLAIRSLWDAVNELRGSVNQPPVQGELSDHQIAQAKKALEAGGSNPLRLDRLQGRVDTPPAVGSWSLQVSVNGNGFYIWDHEDISQADYYTMNSDGTIKILVTGKYHVNAGVTSRISAGNVATAILRQNGSGVDQSTVTGLTAASDFTHRMSKKLVLKAGDAISVELTAGGRRVGGPNGESVLNISREPGWDVQGG